MMHHQQISRVGDDLRNRAIFMQARQDRSLLAPMIDHTLLLQHVRKSEIEAVCREAISYQFRAVCVAPSMVVVAKSYLKSALNIKVATVIGFPNGYSVIRAKSCEIQEAIGDGADEFDFVHDLGVVKDHRWQELSNQYQSLRKTAGDKILKVILETSLLTDDEIFTCSKIACQKGIDVVKTSTGFGGGGATTAHVALMAQAIAEEGCESSTCIKASGGIREFEDAVKLVDAGASILGTSKGCHLIGKSLTNSSESGGGGSTY